MKKRKLSRDYRKRRKQVLVEFDAPEDLVSEFDRIVITKLRYQSRAEALRDYMRKIVREYGSP